MLANVPPEQQWLMMLGGLIGSLALAVFVWWLGREKPRNRPGQNVPPPPVRETGPVEPVGPPPASANDPAQLRAMLGQTDQSNAPPRAEEAVLHSSATPAPSPADTPRSNAPPPTAETDARAKADRRERVVGRRLEKYLKAPDASAKEERPDGEAASSDWSSMLDEHLNKPK